MSGFEVATKQDLKVLEVDIKALEMDIKALEMSTKQNIKALEKDLIIKMGAMIFTSFTALATLMTVLHFH